MVRGSAVRFVSKERFNPKVDKILAKIVLSECMQIKFVQKFVKSVRLEPIKIMPTKLNLSHVAAESIKMNLLLPPHVNYVQLADTLVRQD